MKICFAAGMILAAAMAFAATNDAAVASMERKLQRLETNAAAARPDPTPTEFTEQEINAYFASGRVELPAGVKTVNLQFKPGVVNATTRVDFDQLDAGRSSANPLLGIFTGVHEVAVSTHAYGSHGQGVVHVDSVALDGVEIPRFVLQLFVEKFLQPMYPEVGLDSRFRLPERVDAAVVGLHKVLVTQK